MMGEEEENAINTRNWHPHMSRRVCFVSRSISATILMQVLA
jgi:hypothetical protein